MANQTNQTQRSPRIATEPPLDEPPIGAEGSNTQKDPSEWKTGDEPMTGAQASYLKTLCDEMKEPFDPSLTKAQASLRIDELRARDPRLQRQQEDRS